MNDVIAFRIDDIGSASKKYEVYGKDYINFFNINLPIGAFSNCLFLKYVKPFKKWGPYRELTADEWYEVLQLLRKYRAKLTVGITASWVSSEQLLIPFPEKYPDEAAAIKVGVEKGLLEVANHGLTHCVLQDGFFRPKLFKSNRRYHREFLDWIRPEIHQQHLKRSQEILQNYYKTDIVTFVPPGNVWTTDTEKFVVDLGMKYISAKNNGTFLDRSSNAIKFVSEEHLFPFHDRDLVMKGIGWLERKILQHNNKKILTVRELGERLQE